MGKVNKILWLLPAAVAFSFGFNYPEAGVDDSGSHLFKIGRSRDANEILYDLNIDHTGRPDPLNPISIYWIKRTKNNTIEPLTGIQRRLAYGIKILDQQNSPEIEWNFQFVSYSKRTFKPKQTSESTFKVFTLSSGKEIEVERIFVQIDGGSFRVPSISKVELHGVEPSTGVKVLETIQP